jgi:acetolactate decarboxylase
MATFSATVPASLKRALDDERQRTRRTYSSIVTAALSQYLGVPVHTLFQVSVSGALVAGVFDGEVSVESILEHGDFGLGTFAHLDGEMVVLDGHAYQVQGSGRVSEAAMEIVHMIWLDGYYDLVATQEKLKYGRSSGTDLVAQTNLCR